MTDEDVGIPGWTRSEDELPWPNLKKRYSGQLAWMLLRLLRDPGVGFDDERVMLPAKISLEDHPGGSVADTLDGLHAMKTYLTKVAMLERMYGQHPRDTPSGMIDAIPDDAQRHKDPDPEVDWTLRNAQPDITLNLTMPLWVARRVLDVLESCSMEARRQDRDWRDILGSG